VHGTVEGPSGKLLNYTVAPMEIASPSGAQDDPLTMDVAGTIAVSPSEDGLVEIDLSTTCRTQLAKSAVMGQGRVHFRAKPGETAALLLPNPAGRIALPAGGGFVDLPRAFAGHQVALYVKVELR
jgi:hypothetical protein